MKGKGESTRKLNVTLFSLSFVGLVLSAYTLYVEHNLMENPDAVALCDINQHMSCSKAFSSQFGRGFGFLGKIFGEDSVLNQPNSIPGIFYYLVYCLLSLSNSRTSAGIVLGASVASLCMSVYLAYVLLFILEDICVVCFSIHLINVILIITAFIKYKTISSRVIKTKHH